MHSECTELSWVTELWVIFSASVFLSMFRQSGFFFSSQWPCQKKTNQSLIHYNGRLFVPSVSLSDSTRTDSLSSIISVLICFTATLQRQTVKLEIYKTSNTMTTLKQFNYSYFSLRSLVSPDRSEGKYIWWVELMWLLITTVNVFRLPWFKESLRIPKLPGNSPRIWEEVQ